MTGAKPLVFLADLSHDQHAHKYCVPLNIGCLAAMLEREFGSAVEVRLFKFPGDLLAALPERPDVLGLSNYDWNANLDRAMAEAARAADPEVFVVMGGPSIRSRPEGVRRFLEENPQVDAYVMFEGEEAFAGLVGHLLGRPGRLRETLVAAHRSLAQVAYLDRREGFFSMGPFCPSLSLKRIPFPSAWLSGRLDPFLDDRRFPLVPIIETSRGCPFCCTYCTGWGSAATGIRMVRQYDLETVFEELDHIFRRAGRTFQLYIGDGNFGILERDLKIAERIRILSDKYGKAASLSLDVINGNIGRNVEILKVLGESAVTSFAQQTFNDHVLANIKRKGLGFNRVRAGVSAVHAIGSKISTDLLLGLPGESKADHIRSVKMAYQAGFDWLKVSDIRLAPGTEMELSESRERFGLEGRYRVIPNAFGEYAGRRVVEYEYCVRRTAAMSEREFLELRLLHGHILLLMNVDVGRPLLDLAERHGVDVVDLVEAVSTMPPRGKFPGLAARFKAYMDHAAHEWFASRREADRRYLSDEGFRLLQERGFPKLNYDYAARLVVERGLAAELLGWTAFQLRRLKPELDAALVAEVAAFSAARLVTYPFDWSPRRLRLSPRALRETTRYIDGAATRPPHGGASSGGAERRRRSSPYDVELSMPEEMVRRITDIMAGYRTTRDRRHGVHMVLEYENKAFLRRARLV
ncbi:MAG: cobalamin B12-binding domain-containing protein [Elusimicrobia bacterium]|nr:cobalamin B12-binding domain-containing protein [Elusimicrobiota bacterium]